MAAAAIFVSSKTSEGSELSPNTIIKAAVKLRVKGSERPMAASKYICHAENEEVVQLLKAERDLLYTLQYELAVTLPHTVVNVLITSLINEEYKQKEMRTVADVFFRDSLHSRSNLTFDAKAVGSAVFTLSARVCKASPKFEMDRWCAALGVDTKVIESISKSIAMVCVRNK